MRKLAYLAIILLAAGCGQDPVLQLTSRDPDARWLQGQQVIRRESDGVSVVASFSRSWGGHLIFDIMVANRSDSTLLIEPQQFNYTLASTRDGLRPAFRKPHAAGDPEVELARLDKHASEMESSHATSTMLNAFTDLADMVADLAETGSRTEAEEDRDAQLDLERAIERHQADEDHESTMASLSQRRESLATRALRRTHLGPGEWVSGKIALPVASIPRLLARPVRSGSITDFIDRSALAPDDTLTLILHLPIGAGTEGMEYVVRKL